MTRILTDYDMDLIACKIHCVSHLHVTRILTDSKRMDVGMSLQC